MANMNTSKEILNKATSNLDADIANIKKTNETISSTLSQQSSLLNQLKSSLSSKESFDNQANKEITSSLKSSSKTFINIGTKLQQMSANINQVTSVISNNSSAEKAQVSLLGSIQTSLVQITSVLTAFRADYLLSNTGNKVDGYGYYDVNALNNLTNEIKGYVDSSIQNQLNSAANYANKASNVVRGRLGNSDLDKSDEKQTAIDKALGAVTNVKQMTGILGLLSLSKKKKVKNAGTFFNKFATNSDTSSIGGLLGSLLGDEKTNTILNPLKELSMDLQESNSPFKRFIGNFLKKNGISKDKKEREKDPNLVMSSLAPFADDIKDLVEYKVEGLHERPKSIPDYATPVWVVNSKEQENYIKNVHETKDEELTEKRLQEIMEGIANNTKDKYGNSLFESESHSYNDGKNTIVTYGGTLGKKTTKEKLDKIAKQSQKHQYEINHEVKPWVDEEGNIHTELSDSQKSIRKLGEKDWGILDNFDLSNGVNFESIFGGAMSALQNQDKDLGTQFSESKNAFLRSGKVIKNLFGHSQGSHSKGKKGKRRSKNNKKNKKNKSSNNIRESIAKVASDPERNEPTVGDGQITPITDETTILTAKETKDSKTNEDILNALIVNSAGLNSLVDISIQENILLSHAVNSEDNLVNPLEMRDYTSSFLGLQLFTSKHKISAKISSIVNKFKENANIKKLLKKPEKDKKDKEEGSLEEETKENPISKLINKFLKKPLDKIKEFAKGKLDKAKGFVKGKLDKAKNFVKGKLKLDKAEELLETKKNALLGAGKKYGKEKFNNLKNKIKNSKIVNKIKNSKIVKKFKDRKKNKTKLKDRIKNSKIVNKLKNSKMVNKIKNSKLFKKLKGKDKKDKIKLTDRIKNNKLVKKIGNSKLGKKVSGEIKKFKSLYDEELKENEKKNKEEEKETKKQNDKEEKATDSEIKKEDLAKQKELEANSKANDTRNEIKESNDKAIAAEEKAADKAELTQEKAANAEEIALKQTNATVQDAIDTAEQEGHATLSLKGLLKNIMTKLSGLPTPAKIALGAAGVATIGIVGAKIVKKIKQAVSKKGKGGSGAEGDDKNSAQGASAEKDSKKEQKEAEKERKRQEKEQKKKEKAEKRAKRKEKAKKIFKRVLGLGDKVYIDDDGNVLKEKDDSPIKMLDDNNNETDETLNVKTPEGKKQYAKRLLTQEFRLSKKKLIKKAFKTVKKGLTKVKNKIKEKKDEIFNNDDNNDKPQTKEEKRASKLNQLLLMASSPFLFMDPKLQKELNNIENSNLGREISQNPGKVSNLLYNMSDGVNKLFKKDEKKKDSSADDTSPKSALGKILNKITDKITKKDEEIKNKYSSDLSNDSFSENASIAYSQMNQNNYRNESLNAFNKSLGLGIAKRGDNGNVNTKSKIINEQRKQNALKLGVLGAGGVAQASTATGGAGVLNTIPLVIKAYEKAGIVGNEGDYNQSGLTVKLDFGNGVTYDGRPDCTGLIDSVIECMGYDSENMNSYSFEACKGIKDKSGNISPDWLLIDDFTLEDIQPGDFCIMHTHGEIGSCVKGTTVYGWNYGSVSGMGKALKAVNLQLKGTDPVESTLEVDGVIVGGPYTRLIRYVGAVSTGSGAGGTSSVTPSGKTVSEFILANEGYTQGRGVSSSHNGIDYIAPEKTPIYSPFGGTVYACAWDDDREIVTDQTGASGPKGTANGSMGNFVALKTNDGNYVRFMHMFEGPMVKTGDKVTAGQQIGIVGNTGDSHGSHLHLEMSSGEWDGDVIDPASYSLTGKGRGKSSLINNDNMEKGSDSSVHIYQRNYSDYLYNSKNDTQVQTLGDSGCGPAAAAMVKKYYNRKKYGGDKKTKEKEEKTETKTSDTDTKTDDAEKTNENDTSTATPSGGSALGKTSTYSDDTGNNFSVKIEQEHIDIFNKCKEIGLSEAAACGVLGNLHQETGGTGEKLKYWAEHHGENGGGIMQWTPWKKHEEWAQANGFSNAWTWETSLAHMVDELENGGNWSNAANADPSLESEGYTPCANTEDFKKLTDPAAAAVNFERAFEVSGDWNGRNSEGIVYKENQLRDRLRVGPAICYYECLVGTYDPSNLGQNSSQATPSTTAGITGFLNLITDGAVDASALTNFTSGSTIWNNPSSSNNTTTDSSTTSTNTSSSNNTSGSGRRSLYGKGKRKIPIKYIRNKYGKGLTSNDTVGFKNAHFVSKDSDEYINTSSSLNQDPKDKQMGSTNYSTSNNNNTNTSVTNSNNDKNDKNSSTSVNNEPAIKNSMTVTDIDDSGNKKSTTSVYTSNNKTTLTTNGKSTIVICNNFSEKSKTDISEILSNFKHLNNTQSNALKVLKAISDLIKEDNPISANILLNNDGLEYILKGL